MNNRPVQGQKPSALFLSPFLPYSTGHGGGLRLQNLLTSLSERYDVHVLCLMRPWERAYESKAHSLCRALDVVAINDLPIPVPSGFAKLTHLYSPPLPDSNLAVDQTIFRQQLTQILAGRRFDLGFVAYFSLAHLAPILKQSVKTLMADSVHMPLTDNRLAARHTASFRSKLYYLSQARKCKRQLREIGEQFDAVLSVTESERRLMEPFMPQATLLNVPIGLELNKVEFQPASDRLKNTVAYVGYFAMDQNIEGARELCRKIMPRVWDKRPNARVQLIGPYPERVKFLETPGRVEVKGMVASPFMDARLLAAPIHLGSGFKTKIAGAMAAGMPVVTTSEGNESIGGRSGEDLMVADDTPAFVDKVIKILDDDSLAERLSNQGRTFVEKNLDWSKNIQPLWDYLERR